MTDYDNPPTGAHRDNTRAAQLKGERLDRAAFADGDMFPVGWHRDNSVQAAVLNVIRGGGTRHHWRGVA